MKRAGASPSAGDDAQRGGVQHTARVYRGVRPDP